MSLGEGGKQEVPMIGQWERSADPLVLRSTFFIYPEPHLFFNCDAINIDICEIQPAGNNTEYTKYILRFLL